MTSLFAPLDNDIGVSEVERIDPSLPGWSAGEAPACTILRRTASSAMRSAANETSSTAAGTACAAKVVIISHSACTSADGTLRLAVDGERAETLPPLPQVGLHFRVADRQAPVSWLGLQGRRTTPTGGWHSLRPLGAAAGGDDHPIFPTENGLRCDTQALDWGASASAVISTSPFSHGAPSS
ncbi:hypothetical protein MJ579_14105 [Klebsiella pneumoniae]|nr:hypothetical protein MJ579_14105 [Klebsiella pneumoniae]